VYLWGSKKLCKTNALLSKNCNNKFVVELKQKISKTLQYIKADKNFQGLANIFNMVAENVCPRIKFFRQTK